MFELQLLLELAFELASHVYPLHNQTTRPLLCKIAATLLGKQDRYLRNPSVVYRWSNTVHMPTPSIYRTKKLI